MGHVQLLNGHRTLSLLLGQQHHCVVIMEMLVKEMIVMWQAVVTSSASSVLDGFILIGKNPHIFLVSDISNYIWRTTQK